ncbi:MAG: PHP domain-containing protein [Megasphaera sp.]|uniref:PHP domain-containing protein n=1 Tax=Megasphaera sp. TaxID=2023260 RepID=UPI0025F8D32B|nr:PHP domain-containing protein [uncultured Megasphaera sp.]
MNVDLHMHTTCSDGVYTPEALTQMAVDAGLGMMAISDHDTVAAYDGSHTFAAGVRVIPAIEISSECDGEDVHILGYGIDTADKGLTEYCRQFKERRFRRALEIVDRCLGLGYDIDRSAIEATLGRGGTVGRPHIARLLVAKGYFPDVKTVFDKLLYRGGPAYVPYHRRTIDECVALIRQAGGMAVLAHPGLLKRTLAEVLTHDFDGVEVYHPKNRGRYEEFLQLAQQRHWYVSGGSDFHGTTGRFPERVGLFTVAADKVRPLLTHVME